MGCIFGSKKNAREGEGEMSLGEIIWLVLIAAGTIYQLPLANSTAEMLGMLTGGVIIGFVPIYIGRKLKRKNTLERIENEV